MLNDKQETKARNGLLAHHSLILQDYKPTSWESLPFCHSSHCECKSDLNYIGSRPHINDCAGNIYEGERQRQNIDKSIVYSIEYCTSLQLNYMTQA